MKNIINPPFLQNIDRWLMLHKPSLWKTNLHYIIFYTLISSAVQSIIAVLYPVDFRNMINVGMIFGYLTVPVLICMVLWIIKMVRYNIHDTFVKQSVLQEFGVFGFNFIALLLIASQLFVMPAIFNWRNGHSISQEENMIVDKGLFFLAHGISDNYNYKRRYSEKGQIREAIYQEKTETYLLSYPSQNRLGEKSLHLETVKFVDLKNNPDTSWYDTVHYYQAKVKKGVLMNYLDEFKELHNRLYPESLINMSSEKIITNFIMQKEVNIYDSLTNINDCNWRMHYGDREWHQHRYIYYVDDFINDFDRAYAWNEHIFRLKSTGRTILWLIISVAFILWMVTLVRWQQILATVIVFALSPIFIGLVALLLFEVFDLDDDFWGPLLTLAVYLFFFVQAIKTRSQDRITPYKNIVTIITTLLFPLIPIASIAWTWHEYIRKQYYYDAEHINRFIYGIDYYTFESYLFIAAELLTFAFVFLAIATFGNILKKQYSLPRNN